MRWNCRLLLIALQRGGHVFSGLAHFIKGGVFFWYGVLTLGRWAGCFAELGWVSEFPPQKRSLNLTFAGVEHQTNEKYRWQTRENCSVR
jgi:Protein of unknown function (Ytp1)